MMVPPGGKSHWSAVKIAILFFGILLQNSSAETCRNKTKNILFISGKKTLGEVFFPSEVVYHEVSGTKLCFNIQTNNSLAGCCHESEFNCSLEIQMLSDNKYSLILEEKILSEQDIVLMKTPDTDVQCMPSHFYKNTSDSLLYIHDCLDQGVRNIMLTKNNVCGSSSPDKHTIGQAETKFNLTIDPNGGRYCAPVCKPPKNITRYYAPVCNPPKNITLPPSNGSSSVENAVNVINGLPSLLNELGNSTTATITIGDIKGWIARLSSTDPTSIDIGFTPSKDVTVVGDNTNVAVFSTLVHIPKEASDMAIKRNGTFAGVVLFPGMHQDYPDRTFYKDEAIGIDMGAKIYSLSETIDIHYKNVDKNGSIASCRSWDGKGQQAMWITDGCETTEANNSITCQCSHLTFFAILLSPPPQNISSSDFTALTYITSIGCGLSMFFLAVGVFMHCFVRKGKASHGTKILINLFVAMLALNFSFLINETIANLGNFGACVAMAAAMHYSLLATFSWFFIQALHLYFNLWKLHTLFKNYMMKMCIAGWVTPAVVVIGLLASAKYDYLVISTDDGNSAKMCWISDAAVHQGVNVGYYSLVFIVTFTVFIITVRQIVILESKATKDHEKGMGSIKTNIFSIIGLFLLLGIAWAFAFFSHGPMLIPSYYIFTILNSFQGFFLFIYYHRSGKAVKEVSAVTSSSSNTTVPNTVITPPQ